jgi:hypothetical protein
MATTIKSMNVRSSRRLAASKLDAAAVARLRERQNDLARAREAAEVASRDAILGDPRRR